MDPEDLAKDLKEKIRGEKEIVEEEEESDLSIKSSKLLEDQFARARELKKQMLEDYRNSTIEEATGCRASTNRFGEFFHRQEQIDGGLRCPECSESEVITDLKLVHGIGPSRERKLKEKGYRTIKQLRDHSKWKDRAEEVLEDLRYDRLEEGFQNLLKWKPSSHPLALKFSGLYEREDFAILDIETMGLTSQPLILVGLGLPEGGKIDFHQVLLKDIHQELAALKSFHDKVKDRRALITFNGKSFDIPFLERRFNYYGEDTSLDHAHFDLYHFSRRSWNDMLPNCRLSTIERKIIGVEREVDIPSSMVPGFYSTYREEENPGPLVPIMEHNRQDILTLSKLLEKLMDDMLDG